MTATATPLTAALDTALGLTGELAPLLRLARVPAAVIAAANELDAAVLALIEANLCEEHGSQFNADLSAAVGMAWRLVDALAGVVGADLALTLVREDAGAARDTLARAVRVA